MVSSLSEVWKFEKRIWKEFKQEILFSSPLSLSPLAHFPGPFSFSSFLFPGPRSQLRPPASFSPPRALAAHAGPTRSPADPTAPPPFSFCAGGWQVGPGRQALPLPPAAGWSHLHSWPPAVTGRVRCSPAIKSSQSSHNEAPPSFPPLQTTVTSP
jgi:hypothetical protein